MQLDPLTLILLVVLGAGGLAALGLIATRRPWIVLPVAAMVLFSSMGRPLDWRGRIMQTALLPIQENRSNLYLAFGIATGLLVLVHGAWARGKGVALPAVIMLVMSYYAGVMRAAHGAPTDGLLTLVYATVTLIPLSLAIKIAVDDLPDFNGVLRALAGAGAVWIFLAFVQFILDRHDVVTGKQLRFIGLTSNPQHAGTYLSVMVTITLYLALNDPTHRVRVISMILAGVNVVLLGWTGSRTGLGMAVLGITAVLYTRAGRAILFLPVIALVAAAAIKLLSLAGVSAFGFGRLVDTTNTRRSAWQSLLNDGMANPLIGTGIEDAVRSENGYLFGFAVHGIGMLLLALLLTAVSAVMCLQLIAGRASLPREYRTLVDLVVGYMVVYFAGSIFEGYMMARVAPNLTYFIIFASMGALLLKLQKAYAGAGELEYEEYTEDPAVADYGYQPEPA